MSQMLKPKTEEVHLHISAELTLKMRAGDGV